MSLILNALSYNCVRKNQALFLLIEYNRALLRRYYSALEASQFAYDAFYFLYTMFPTKSLTGPILPDTHNVYLANSLQID